MYGAVEVRCSTRYVLVSSFADVALQMLRRACVKVLRSQEGGAQRVGNLVSMGSTLWAPTGACISVFDPKTQVCDGVLGPPHAGFITQICRVRQRETRILWSYSLADKSAKIWLKETSGDVDMQQLVDELRGSQCALEHELQAQRVAAERQRSFSQALQSDLMSRLEDALVSSSCSQIRSAELEESLQNARAELDKTRLESVRREAEAAAEILHLRELVDKATAQANSQDAARQADLEIMQRKLHESERQCAVLREEVKTLSHRANLSAEDYSKLLRSHDDLLAAKAASDPELRRLRELVAHLEEHKVGMALDQGRLEAAQARLAARTRRVRAARE